MAPEPRAAAPPCRLEAEGLAIRAGRRKLVHEATLSVRTGEVVALVGSSGSGKSVTARALLGLLPFRPGLVGGSARIDGEELRTDADFQRIRGSRLTLIPQDGRDSLDPLWTVGRTVAEAARLAGGDDPRPWLRSAGFDQPDRVAGLYPHELSGGMAQRAAIAAALARQSPLLIADECTTGLDASVQRRLLEGLRTLADTGRGVLVITHDLRIIPGFADRIVVMEDGRTVEEAASVGALRGPGRNLVEATRRVSGGVL